jgi:sugar/nucleoside kinase (ribokinase family)
MSKTQKKSKTRPHTQKQKKIKRKSKKPEKPKTRKSEKLQKTSKTRKIEMSLENNPDILFVGHCTRDEITINSKTEKIPGGGVYFGSMSAGYCSQSLKKTPLLTVLTIGNPEDLKEIKKECDKAKVTLNILPDKNTTTFCHSFIDNDPDKRISTVPKIARSFTLNDIKDYKSKFTYVNPLFYGEIPSNLFKELKKRTKLLSVDSQGLLRNLIKEKIIMKPPKEIKEIFKYIDILKVDLAEAKILTGKEDWEEACKDLIKMGVKFVICTRTDEVSVMDKNFESNTAEFGEWSLIGRTGRGDTVSGAFIFMHFILGMDRQNALEISAKATGKKMMHSGAAKRKDFN